MTKFEDIVIGLSAILGLCGLVLLGILFMLILNLIAGV